MKLRNLVMELFRHHPLRKCSFAEIRASVAMTVNDKKLRDALDSLVQQRKISEFKGIYHFVKK